MHEVYTDPCQKLNFYLSDDIIFIIYHLKFLIIHLTWQLEANYCLV